jgi:hypothetical protein
MTDGAFFVPPPEIFVAHELRYFRRGQKISNSGNAKFGGGCCHDDSSDGINVIGRTAWRSTGEENPSAAPATAGDGDR